MDQKKRAILVGPNRNVSRDLARFLPRQAVVRLDGRTPCFCFMKKNSKKSKKSKKLYTI